MEGQPPRGMKIKIASIAKPEKWVDDVAQCYIRRFESKWAFEQIFIKPTQNKVVDGQKFLKILPKKNIFFVALDEKGKTMTSVEFAHFLKNHEEIPIFFGIGGANGWDDAVKKEAHFLLSLSKMTFAHSMARLFLCEQLYRAYSLTQNLPYHRA